MMLPCSVPFSGKYRASEGVGVSWHHQLLVGEGVMGRMPHGRVELEKGVEQPEHCDLWTLLVFLFVIVWL